MSDDLKTISDGISDLPPLPQAQCKYCDVKVGLVLDERFGWHMCPICLIEQRNLLMIKLVTACIKFNKELDEYCVEAYDEKGERLPEADYFTSDKEDAKGTAELMVFV